MPTGLKGGQQVLVPPATRVLPMFTRLQEAAFRDTPRRLARARLYASHLTRKGG